MKKNTYESDDGGRQASQDPGWTWEILFIPSQIQDLKTCKEQTGFKIFFDSSVEAFNSTTLGHFRDLGDQHSVIKPVLLLSFTPNYNESICSFSYNILTILKDNRSSLFIYEIPDVETKSTATTTTSTTDNEPDKKMITKFCILALHTVISLRVAKRA